MPRNENEDEVEQFALAKRQYQNMTGFQRVSFFAEDSRFTMNAVALTAKLAALLFVSFSILDFIVYNNYFLTFFGLRVICAIIILMIGRVSGKKWARRRYRLFAMLIPLVAAFFISAMIFIVGDPGTIYYAGLNLCIVCAGSLFQWTSREAMITSVIVFGLYFVSTLPALGKITTVNSLSVIVSNCLFIISTAIVVIVGAYNHKNFRFDEFITRSRLRKNQADLADKNLKLQETLKTLSLTEKQLYQSEKMSFLGEMSAGVIHEIGNPLNYTNQALFILRRRIAKSEDENLDVKEVIDDMQEGIDRIRAIVADLREFSHTGIDTGEGFSADSCFQSALRMLQKPIKESGAEVTIDLEPGMDIKGVKNQITQVVTNLIHNAVQAMASHHRVGKLTITGKILSDGSSLISISDNGPGISDQDIKKLFNPFFTTKDPGEGTGLGLSICYRIIEAHQGKIEVETAPDVGTTFKVLLPG